MADELKAIEVRVARLEAIVHELRSKPSTPPSAAGTKEKDDSPPPLAPAPPVGSKGGPR
jgi:hypothetical protein